jgi:hypothetical protein
MNLSPTPIFKGWDNNGKPLVGGKLFTYVAGTSTKIATYTDDSGVSQNTNPVILDYRGEARVWLDTELSYKFVLAPADDTDPPTRPIWTVNNISQPVVTVSQEVFDELLGTSPPYSPTSTEILVGASIVNPTFFPGNVRRYGATGGGVVDDTVAVQTAFNVVMIGGGRVYIPRGRYRVNQLTATWANHGVRVEGDWYDTTDGGSQLEYIGPAAGSCLRLIGFSGIHPINFSGIAFVNVSGNSAYGVKLESWRNADIHDCYFEGFDRAIWPHAKAGYATVNDVSEFCYFNGCYFNDNLHAIYAQLQVHNIFTSQNRYLAQRAAPIFIEWVNDPTLGSTFVHHWVVRDSWIYGDSNTTQAEIVCESGGKGFLIDGCYFEYNVSGSPRPLISFGNAHVQHSGVRVTNSWMQGYVQNPGGVIQIGNCNGFWTDPLNLWARNYSGSPPANGAFVQFTDTNVFNYEVYYPALATGGELVNTLVDSVGSLFTAKLVDSNEGVWTPGVAFGGASVGVTYTTQEGWFRKTGNQVVVLFRIVLSAKGSSTGSMTVTGLPSQPSAFGPVYGASGGVSGAGNFSGLTGSLALNGTPSTSSIAVVQSNAAGQTAVTDAQVTNTTTINGTFVYFT